MKTIYLDHAAATPLHPEVYSAMLPFLSEIYGNPSSIHHSGRQAYDALTHARAQVADTLHVDPTEIIFASSGTEANNLALFGLAQTQKKHILVSAIEHVSVLKATERLTAQGYAVEYIPVDHTGRISVEDVISRIRAETCLISVMYANNEIGTVQPIKELAQILRSHYSEHHRPLLHTDACQAAGQLPISPHELGVDLMTLNSSKIYGPKGIGMLYVRKGVLLTSCIIGGEQEFGHRAGTENVAGIIGFAHALKLAVSEQPTANLHITNLREICIHELVTTIPGIHINGHRIERLPNNVHISLPYIEGESLVLMLDTYGICASTGSACNAHNLLPSHVLRAIGQPPEIIHGSLRLTLGRTTTREDILYTVQALAACTERLQSMSPLTSTI